MEAQVHVEETTYGHELQPSDCVELWREELAKAILDLKLEERKAIMIDGDVERFENLQQKLMGQKQEGYVPSEDRRVAFSGKEGSRSAEEDCAGFCRRAPSTAPDLAGVRCSTRYSLLQLAGVEEIGRWSRRVQTAAAAA